MKISYREELTLPSLLWRIDEAEQSRYARGASLAVYRADVLRNLRWLLNASTARAADPIWKFPGAAASVLNFGITPYSGMMGSSLDLDDVASSIREAILAFEPRIIPSTLEVERIGDQYDDEGNSVPFRISGSIWSQPVPERFSLETAVDTTSGAWTFDG